MLERFTLKNLKQHTTRNGVAWTARIDRDGKPWAIAEDDGNGGAVFFRPAPRTGYSYREINDYIENTLGPECKRMTGSDWEPFGMAVSATEPGETVDVGARRFRAMTT